MTPMLAWLECRLPPAAARVCLVLIYAFVLFAVLLLIGKDQQHIHYLDAGIL